jgi:acyl-CoA hydrolase
MELYLGPLLMDEELALYSIINLRTKRVVTKYMSEINFRSLQTRDIIEIGIDVVKFGTTSLLKCSSKYDDPRNDYSIANTTMVNLGDDGAKTTR